MAIVGSRAAGIPALVLMLAPGVVVPLGFSISLDREPPTRSFAEKLLVPVAPFAAAAGVLGWLVPPGHVVAIGSAALHGAVCLLGGFVGVSRLLARRGERFGPLHEIVADVGLVLLPVAGAWFVASRSAVGLLGFQEPVVTFTAAHFHYAGFAAPTILGGVGRLLDEGRGPSRLYRVAAAAVCAGVPLTAIGIVTHHVVEATSAVLLAAGMLCASVLLVFRAARYAVRHSKLAAALFVVSGGTLLLTMSLAATFALTSSAGRGSSLAGAVPLQTMIDWHGGANAIGFSLGGLAALAMLASARSE